MHAEGTQRQHYNRIAAEYEAQYGDVDGVTYREEFLYRPMFAGLDLEGRSVLEALSGSGHATGYLLRDKKALVTGLDISEEAIASFKTRWPACQAICSSITASGLPDESFDCIVVVMGLHHLQPHLSDVLSEIHRLLRKGGVFCFAEPHRESAFSRLRAIWYRHDSLFADNEESLDIEPLKRECEGLFEFRVEKYVGSVAYLLVLNSMIFRVPLWLKRMYSPALMCLEKMLAGFHSRRFSLAIICQWKRK
ncbi:MAG TPA: class I SAM-dependent methyltransferase [Pyrinomonadaceae bacterium]|jgi:SAM-dependent methyltransferase